MTIAVDFDATLMDRDAVHSGYRMGPPTAGAILAMQRLAAEGHQLWVFTARDVQHPNQKKAVADWLDYFHIPFHGVTNIKRPEFEVFVDDRAIAFDSWPQVMFRLTKLQESSTVQA